MTRQVALITGSGRRRVGFVIAKDLAQRGYDIAVHYHSSEDEARESVEQLREAGVQSEAYQANIAEEADVDRMFAQLSDAFGRLDVLVTTAAIWDSKPLEETTAADVERSFRINTLGTYLCVRRGGLLMAKQPTGGSIITIGDWAIQRPYPDHSAYFLSKGAIPTLTRTMAVELAQRNSSVRVNCIHPGPVMLPPGSSDEQKQARAASTLVKRADEPTTVAQAVRLFIDNPFLTGTCLHVDGGRSIYAGEFEDAPTPI